MACTEILNEGLNWDSGTIMEQRGEWDWRKIWETKEPGISQLAYVRPSAETETRGVKAG